MPTEGLISGFAFCPGRLSRRNDRGRFNISPPSDASVRRHRSNLKGGCFGSLRPKLATFPLRYPFKAYILFSGLRRVAILNVPWYLND